MDAQIRMFKKAIKTNGETLEANIINLFNCSLRNSIYKWGDSFVQDHPNCTFEKLEQTFYKRFRTMKRSTCNCETYNNKPLNLLRFIMNTY